MLTYWCVTFQLPVYIAQKGTEGGLQWGQEVKGLIFMIWALVAKISPAFTGGFSDKFGYRRSLFVSFALFLIGFATLATQRTFVPFLAGTIILGLGSGIFRPVIQGAIASELNETNSAVGWGLYFSLLNFAVFFAPPLGKFLKEFSWTWVFWGSAGIFSLNFAFVFLARLKAPERSATKAGEVFKKIYMNFSRPEVLWFVLIMSGFAIVYMQFYETLPNFIIDWSDTSGVASTLKLPDFMTMTLTRGEMISYEWLYNINTAIVILGAAIVSKLASKLFRINAIIIGLILSTAGLFAAGSSTVGGFLLIGIVVYTFGEITVNPKFNEHMAAMSPMKDKALYMSYLNISLAIGFGAGGYFGGLLYKNLGEKASLAQKYLAENYGLVEGITPHNALRKLTEFTGASEAQITQTLWNAYDPWIVWIPFVACGAISAFALIWYGKNFGRRATF